MNNTTIAEDILSTWRALLGAELAYFHATGRPYHPDGCTLCGAYPALRIRNHKLVCVACYSRPLCALCDTRRATTGIEGPEDGEFVPVCDACSIDFYAE